MEDKKIIDFNKNFVAKNGETLKIVLTYSCSKCGGLLFHLASNGIFCSYCSSCWGECLEDE
ncbi:hypothetical protein M0R19_05315 [Candidatus Pacearchaeota archaeon]|jgi:uncharacterized Zn finger protein (UPF0148 family)|nr:hypothetical protein [Candidatus Pacearchaeota archaeon]